jgi:hypothetical protein
MLRFVKVTTVGTVGAMALFLGAAFYSASAIAHDQPAHHPGIEVRWNPSRLNASVKPGETVSIPVSFTAKERLDDLSVVFASKSLKGIVAVSPTSFPALKKGQTATVTVQIKLPILAEAGTSTGFIQLYEQSKRWKKPMPIQWALPIIVTTQCPCLPPDPGEAGKATIEGIDSDNDGVRDDVQRYIASTYPNSARARAAASGVAREFQRGLVLAASGGSFDFLLWDPGFSGSVDCLWFVMGGRDAVPARRNLVAEFLNTRERSMAYVEMNRSAAGTVTGGASPGDYRAGCSFDPMALPN